MLTSLEKLLLLPSALLALTGSYAFGTSIVAGEATGTSKALPSPYSFPPDQYWDGVDGSWSSFSVSIGTPPQYVRTFISWAVYQTWAVIPAGCNTTGEYSTCANARGGIYTETKSTSFQSIGLFGLDVEGNLGYQGDAYYGYDTVGLGGLAGSGPTLPHTIVAGMAYDDFYFPIFGINPKPTNFTTFDDPLTSYMTLLKERKHIASVSFGYTAGAPYRFTGVYGSLTLGGYDSSLFVENDVTWTFAPDNSRDIVVAIQSISTPSQGASSTTPKQLLPGPIYAYMDATIAEIWLPVSACKAFEDEFGLTYNETTELYLVDSTLHEQLKSRNPSITFTLGTDFSSSGNTVSIELPYAAFDLTAKAPYQGLTEQSLYFPLRRSANETQYTIGRTFFQEAYITIDYEAQRFNVSQRVWNQNQQSNIITIPPGTDPEIANPSSGSSSSDNLSSGVLAAIAIGAVAIIAVASMGAYFLFFRRKQAQRKQSQHEKLGSDAGSLHASRGATGSAARTSLAPINTVFAKFELAGSTPRGWQDDIPLDSPVYMHSEGSRSPRTQSEGGYGTYSSHSGTWHSAHSEFRRPSELDSKEQLVSELPEAPVFEMAGDMPSVGEKDGKALTEKEAIAHRERVYNGVESQPVSAVSPGTAAAAAAESSTLSVVSPQEASPDRERVRRVVNPEEVLRGATEIDDAWPSHEREFTEHRGFSFEGDRDEE